MTIRSSGKIGILYLDVEGGWGGSSRSLYYMIEYLDRDRFQPIVVLRKPGPIEKRYRTLGVPCVVVPEMPAFRPSERKNPVSFALFLWESRRRPRLYARLDELIEGYDLRLIHVNHESLALIGSMIARRLRLPWISHVRTLLIPSFFARQVYRLVNRRAAHAVFIAEPNRQHFARLVGGAFDSGKASVVLNITPIRKTKPAPLPIMERPSGKFRVLSLTNFSPNRGVDRIVEVAEELKARGDLDFVFYLCGQPANRSALTGRVVPYFEEIRARVEVSGLGGVVRFPGHIKEPERALATCDALIKLTRQSNPWGRDIIEALAAGVPIVTLGTFQGFVEHGVNGFIDECYDPARVADHLVRLKTQRVLRERMAKENRAKAVTLFEGCARAREIEAIYSKVLTIA